MIGTHILTPSGRQIISNYAQCAAAAINILFNMLLIPRYNSTGAAIASVISELTVMIIYFVMVHKEIDFEEMLKCGWKKLVAALIMFAVLIVGVKFDVVSIGKSVIQIITGIIIYISVLLILKDEFVLKKIYKVLSKIKKNKEGY